MLIYYMILYQMILVSSNHHEFQIHFCFCYCITFCYGLMANQKIFTLKTN